ncbi:MAG: UDP-N-acetylmuramoyl-tripeptide--D-alanyl-D-alanine ligase [Candidatus Doudnabacteria bacterium]|jgi:UDP-N-acetylmuramoyl-tripeptide--D-alanyl-D-alanine ligase
MLNLFKVIKYQLYLLQLENYELGRFWKLLLKKGFWPKEGQRKNLVWTMKAVLIFGLTELVIFGLSLWMARLLFLNALENTVAAFVAGLGVFYFFQFCGFIFLSLSTILLIPADWLVKQVIINRAQFKIKRLKDLKIIGIAGSYGKTTMKEVLRAVLSSKYHVASAPESVNTPVGIARWVLKNFESTFPSPQPSPARGEGGQYEIAIIEMGEHYKGDVEEICNIAKPDVAVVTGINEAHLERMKTLENITDTVFEVVSKSKAGALIVLNGDDKNVTENYKNYIWPDHKLEFYGKNSSKSKFQISNFKFDTEKLGWDAIIDGGEKIFINLLGGYALGDVMAAVKIAQSLGMNNEEILNGIANIKPVEHRLQPIKSAGGVLVIDDAYNGNPAGVVEAIKVLLRFQNRRKLFITPGLVETGKATVEIHREIGKQLAEVADVVILIRNSVTGYIEEGINESSKYQVASSKYKKPEVIYFNTAQEAHSSLSKILQPNDVIVFQNDWGDQYI